MRKKIKIEVVAECCHDPETNISTLHQTMPDFEMKIGKGEVDVGSVAGCIGADIEMKDRSVSGTLGIYYIHPVDLWNAFQVALKKKGYINKALILSREIANKEIKDVPKN